jgi:hypothetical protein
MKGVYFQKREKNMKYLRHLNDTLIPQATREKLQHQKSTIGHRFNGEQVLKHSFTHFATLILLFFILWRSLQHQHLHEEYSHLSF